MTSWAPGKDMGIITSILVYSDTWYKAAWALGSTWNLKIPRGCACTASALSFQSLCTQQDATSPIGASRQYWCKSIHRPSSSATARRAELEVEDHGARNQHQPAAANQVTSHMTSLTGSISYIWDVTGVYPVIWVNDIIHMWYHAAYHVK